MIGWLVAKLSWWLDLKGLPPSFQLRAYWKDPSCQTGVGKPSLTACFFCKAVSVENRTLRRTAVETLKDCLSYNPASHSRLRLKADVLTVRTELTEQDPSTGVFLLSVNRRWVFRTLWRHELGSWQALLSVPFLISWETPLLFNFILFFGVERVAALKHSML